MKKIHFINANLILRDTIVEDGSLLIEDGCIRSINPEVSTDCIQYDLQGKYLMPGMIDLHCDALEKEVEPRPNVHFPLDFACAQADRRNAAAGITTVYHALSFANDELGVRNNQFAAEVARAVHQWQPHALVDNRVHCRYEITDESGLPVLLQLLDEDAIHLVSLMDHTPGQGQFKDLAAYRDYLTRTYRKTADEVEVIVERKISAASGAYERMTSLAEAARLRGVSVASHDDDSIERIDTMRSVGANISEFPVNLETATAARQAGMATIFGAPNILRGKSQSGSIRAIEAVKHGVADCLCADYSPATLIASVFRIPEQCHMDLPTAIQMVTRNPAAAAGLHDRGEIVEGKRADLTVVQMVGIQPLITDVWVHGKQAYHVLYNHG